VNNRTFLGDNLVAANVQNYIIILGLAFVAVYDLARFDHLASAPDILLLFFRRSSSLFGNGTSRRYRKRTAISFLCIRATFAALQTAGLLVCRGCMERALFKIHSRGLEQGVALTSDGTVSF
jgi:hypothetical protein